MLKTGSLALVLHSHLPFVHHPESEKVMEERWLFEAITESYVPLLQVFERLGKDGIPFQLTMSLTPTLLTMFANPLLQERYVRHLDQQISLAEKETIRHSKEPELQRLALFYLNKFTEIRELFVDRYSCDLRKPFRDLHLTGKLELITSSATHAFLPYIRTEQAIRSQLENAVIVHADLLGVSPRGIWLPECGYVEGMDRLLADYGLRFFFTDSHVIEHAYPKPTRGLFAPIRTPSGPFAFARDQEASSQVWSSLLGYPGDVDYREFYRDIAYEREEEYIAPHLHPSGIRLDSGLKYFRITGSGEHKLLYVPEWAEGKVAAHAKHFADLVERRIQESPDTAGPHPLVVASYDTELFGHWWYEGPQWLERLCREIAVRQERVRLTTPLNYLQVAPEPEKRHLSFASWGRGGYGEVWLGENNAWLYRHMHRMEENMIRLADAYPAESGLMERALNQAARELLLAQSSDWAFIMDGGTVVEYAIERFRRHETQFQALATAIRSGTIEESTLVELEQRDAICPSLDYRVYQSSLGAGTSSKVSDRRPLRQNLPNHGRKLKVLMLAWEFPPMVVGGLSRHVFELSRKLASRGHDIHVLTTHVEGYPSYEVVEGVSVHRIQTFQTRSLDFMEWVFQFNLRMADYGRTLLDRYGPFDLVHAHDWLVGEAARAIKHRFTVPLVATIHATEHGRNHGLHSSLNHRIHSMEWDLTYEAATVIVCSRYMEQEMLRLFNLPASKIAVIPNGIDPASLYSTAQQEAIRANYALPHERIVLFVGRLVREKGVQVLLEAIPQVLAVCPDAKFIIGGKGPMLQDLLRRANQLGIMDRVAFVGFVDDETRNALFRFCSAAVFPSLYEPFGIVALEAMAAGAPVIVSGTGGLTEIVDHGQDGYTVLPGNVESLQSHLIQLLQDGSTAHQMAQRAHRKVLNKYDWNSVADHTVQVYEQYAMASTMETNHFEEVVHPPANGNRLDMKAPVFAVPD
jgi:1,4-alpha-glucan branching enzyme